MAMAGNSTGMTLPWTRRDGFLDFEDKIKNEDQQ